MTRHERSAGFICYRRRADVSSGIEYLLLDYGRHWEYAKGHVDPGESDLDAAVRELREETGISDVHVVEGFRHELLYFFVTAARVDPQNGGVLPRRDRRL